MIRSSFLRQPAKLSSTSAVNKTIKSISLAAVASQLQSTSIVDNHDGERPLQPVTSLHYVGHQHHGTVDDSRARQPRPVDDLTNNTKPEEVVNSDRGNKLRQHAGDRAANSKRSRVDEMQRESSSMVAEVTSADSRPLKDSASQNQSLVAAMKRPSTFGQTLCYSVNMSRTGQLKSGLVCKRFRYGKQLAEKANRSKGVETVQRSHVTSVTAFDFSTPSPDDVVKEKQKHAFLK